MKNAIRLQKSTRAGLVARTALLLALTAGLGVNLVELLVDSGLIRSTPTESTRPEKNDTHKTGPWHYVPVGTRV